MERFLDRVFPDAATAGLFDDAVRQLMEDQGALDALMAQHERHVPRTDGVPAVLIIEDFFAPQQPARQAAPGDEGLSIAWTILATALAAHVEAGGGVEAYPSVCPAMSALAERLFRQLSFSQAEVAQDV